MHILGKYHSVFEGKLSYPGLIDIISNSPDYTPDDKQNIMPVFIQVNNLMWEQVTSVNISRIDEFKVPVYFFLGLNDYSVRYELAERYLNHLRVPK